MFDFREISTFYDPKLEVDYNYASDFRRDTLHRAIYRGGMRRKVVRDRERGEACCERREAP